MPTRSRKPQPVAAPSLDNETLEAVLDSVAVPGFAVDASGRLFFASRPLAELLETTRQALVGKTVAGLVSEMGNALPYAQDYRKRVEALARDPKKTSSVEVEYHTDKRLFFKEFTRPIHRSDATHLGRLFLYFDVTRERELDQTKSEFISIASHELRTPMTSIKGSLDLLLGGFAGEVNEETKELLVIAQGGCERLIRLINDILDLSKIEAGRMQLRMHRMSLLDSVHRSVRTIQSYADSFKVSLAIDCDLVPPPDIIGDKDRLDQVVTNLLGNAVKFSPENGTVTVALRCGEKAMACRVVDTGPGIPREQAERIFDKFQQVAGQSKKKGGTGLGLAIARALVEEHGGEIWAESEVGRGSQFVFTIPLAPPEG
jgi:signal transduction histidine kinase